MRRQVAPREAEATPARRKPLALVAAALGSPHEGGLVEALRQRGLAPLGVEVERVIKIPARALLEAAALTIAPRPAGPGGAAARLAAPPPAPQGQLPV